MDLSQIIQLIVTTALTTIITLGISKYLGKFKPAKNGFKSTMEMPKLYIIVSIGLFLFAILFIYLITFETSTEFNTSIQIIFGLFALLMGFGGINNLLLYNRHQVEFDEEEINVIGWRGNYNSIGWKEIEKIKYSSISSSLVLISMEKKVYIHEHIRGYKLFLETLDEKTGLKLIRT